MAAVPMLAGVGLMMVCCSSSVATLMMGGEEKENPPLPKTPEQIKVDEAKADLDALKADPNASEDDIAAAQAVVDDAQAVVDGAGGDYTESCDDLGGGVIVRHESGKDLSDCKTECSANASCKGFIHKTPGFCQLHDNNDPYGVDICDKGYRVYRK